MDFLQQFVFNNVNFEVRTVTREEDGETLFVAADIAKVLGVATTNINKLTQTLEADEKDRKLIPTPGGTQNMVVLTYEGVTTVLSRSNKAVARPLRRWINQVLKSIRETRRYDVDEHAIKIIEEKEREIEMLTMAAENKSAMIHREYMQTVRTMEAELERVKKETSEGIIRESFEREIEAVHRAILASNDKKGLVYIGRIRNEGDKTLVKVGATTDIKARSRALRAIFGSFCVTRAFVLDNCFYLEEFLLKKPEFQKYKHKVEDSTETFLMPDDVLRKLEVTAERNVDRVRGAAIPKKRKRMSDEIQQLTQKVDHLINGVNNGSIVLGVPENDKGQNQNGGVKVQRYSADGKVLLRTYFSKKEAERLEDISIAGIKKSINNNIAVKGYRWANIDASLPDDTVQELPPTAYHGEYRTGCVALLDDAGCKVTQVFLNSTVVARTECTSVSNAIKHIKRQTAMNGKRYMYWDDVPDDARMEYEGPMPEEPPTKRCRRVEQLNPETGAVLHTFTSMKEVGDVINISAKTLKAAITGRYASRGYKWKFVGGV
jgi:prophage antirepressor-like protein